MRMCGAARKGGTPTRSRLLTALMAALLVAAGLSGAVPAAAIPAGFSDTVVYSGLTAPTSLAFAPDGRVFVAEKSGIVKTFDSLQDTTPSTTVDLRPKVHNFWDRGLLGLAVDPAFPSRPYVYVLYAYERLPNGTDPNWDDDCPSPDPGATEKGCVVTGRLSQLTVDTAGVATSEKPLITDWCQQYPSHSIGSLAFGRDGALYVSGGEGASFNFADYGQRGNPCADPPGAAGANLSSPTAKGGALRSQSPRRPSTEPAVLGGAILRVDPDTGDGLPGNPYFGSADANKRRVLAYGLRNPFRFGMRPGTGEVWTGDVGWGTWEEINRIMIPSAPTADTAENFGWPCYEGAGRQPAYDGTDLSVCESLYTGGQSGPYFTYKHGVDVVAGDGCTQGGSAISGIAFENGAGNYPAAYQGALFFTDSSRGCIWALQRGADGLPDPAKRVVVQTGIQFPVQLVIGPGGDLFYVEIGSGEIRRISYPGGANRPPDAVATATPDSGPAPLTVQFDGTRSADPDLGAVLSYAWDLDGDGEFDDSASATPQRTYPESAFVRAGLRVTDQHGASDTAQVDVTVGDAPRPEPVPVIDGPGADVTWQVGQTIEFAGHADDPQDGALPASALSWRLTMQHCVAQDSCHAHVIKDMPEVSGGSFVAPDHEYPSYLDVTLTATDSEGNRASTTTRLDPKTIDLTFTSTPAGLTLAAGGTEQKTPFDRRAIVGSTQSISAPSPQTDAAAGKSYTFRTWSDGGARTHEIVAPATATTFQATYGECTGAECGGPTPSAPRSFTGKGGLRSAALTWSPPAWAGDGGLTGYRVTVQPGGRVVDGIAPDATGVRVTGLATGTTYTFTLQALSAAGAGPGATKKLVGTRASAYSKTIRYGSSTTVIGKLVRVDTGSGLPAKPFRLQARPQGSPGWSTIASGTTSSTGSYSVPVKPIRTTEYRLVYYSGNSAYLGTISSVGTVTVYR